MAGLPGRGALGSGGRMLRCAPTPKCDHRVDRKQVRPADGQGTEGALSGLDRDPGFAPELAGDDLPDHGAARWMEGMRDVKPWRLAGITSSRQLWKRAASKAGGPAYGSRFLTPIPSAPTLEAVNQALLARLDARLSLGRDAAGQTIGTRFAEEQAAFRALPAPFVAEATTLATVSPRALVRLEGAYYSVPCRWAGLDLVARIGATTVTIVGRDGTRIVHPRKRFGQRSIRLSPLSARAWA